MPAIPEELDVFRRPHCHMKQLVKDMEAEVFQLAGQPNYLSLEN